MKTVSDTEGYLLLYKNPGETSFDSLRLIKRTLGTGRVGHTGTLDKFAEGLLLVFIGRATKLVQWFTGCNKTYEACVRFGLETDTLDPEGSVIAREGTPLIDQLEKIIPSFIGPQIQIPPAYSSIHINGKRAHELVRSGLSPEMSERKIHIHALELVAFDGRDAHILVRCSKGTYIRSLARDLGLSAGSRAYLHTLKRTELGGFLADNAYNPLLHGNEEIMGHIHPITLDTFRHMEMPKLQADQDVIKKILHGKPVQIPSLKSFPDLDDRSTAIDTAQYAAVFDKDERFIAMMQKKNDSWKYGFVYARA